MIPHSKSITKLIACSSLLLIPVVPASLLLSDSFETGGGDYTPGPIDGQTGTPETGSYEGSWGFPGGGGTQWGEPEVLSSGLSYSGVASSGGSVLLERTESGTATKTGAANPGGAFSGENIYFSFLMRLGDSDFGTLGVNASSKSIEVGVNSSGQGIIRNGTTVEGTTASPLGFATTDTLYIVGRIENNGGGSGQDRVYMYFNPDPSGSEPGSATLFADVGTDGYWPGAPDLTAAQFSAGLVSGTTGTTFDEIRAGDSWDDVTVIPEPGTLVLLGVALGAVAIFRLR